MATDFCFQCCCRTNRTLCTRSAPGKERIPCNPETNQHQYACVQYSQAPATQDSMHLAFCASSFAGLTRDEYASLVHHLLGVCIARTCRPGKKCSRRTCSHRSIHQGSPTPCTYHFAPPSHRYTCVPLCGRTDCRRCTHSGVGGGHSSCGVRPMPSVPSVEYGQCLWP